MLGSLGVREGVGHDVKVGLGLSRKVGKRRVLRGVLSKERGFRGGIFLGDFLLFRRLRQSLSSASAIKQL